MFLSPEEQEELNTHFRRYSEGEERKKDLYEGYIKGILLVATKSAAKTLVEDMEMKSRQLIQELEDDEKSKEGSIYNPDGSLKSLDDDNSNHDVEDDVSSILSLYNDDGTSMDPSNPLTYEQEMDLREAFDLFDENGDGSICQEELCLAMISTGMYKHTEFNEHDPMIKEIMERLDTNDDGRIGYSEFRKVMAMVLMDGVLGDEDEKEVSHHFENFDVDGNGHISPNDFFLYMSEVGAELTVTEVEQMFLLIDTDGDGQVSYREFKENMYPVLKGQYPELF